MPVQLLQWLHVVVMFSVGKSKARREELLGLLEYSDTLSSKAEFPRRNETLPVPSSSYLNAIAFPQASRAQTCRILSLDTVYAPMTLSAMSQATNARQRPHRPQKPGGCVVSKG